MQTTAKIDARQIDQMDLEICIRMKVCEWQSLASSLPATMTGYELTEQIRSVLKHVDDAVNVTIKRPVPAAGLADVGSLQR